MLRVIASLIFCCLALTAQATDTATAYPSFDGTGYGGGRGPGGWGIFDKGVRLKPQKAQPAACDADNEGVLSMTATHRLCLCDGKAWQAADGKSACQWAAQ